MTAQQNPPKTPSRFLWLTFDFAGCLSAEIDTVTPQLFLTLMGHPAIGQIKRFTAQAENLCADDIAQWEPGIFTLQAYRPSLLDVLTQVANQLTSQLSSDGKTPDQMTITIYTQIGARHYPITTRLSPGEMQTVAADIETMVQQHEKG